VLAVTECGKCVLDRCNRIAVASTMMSTAACAMSACQSSPTYVSPEDNRSVERRRGVALRLPAYALEIGPGILRGQIGNAGQMQAGVFGTWARYMAPNFPAPISPTRSRLPLVSRS